MTIKVIGAIMILFSCGSVGFRLAATQRREERMLESVCCLLEFMECELQYHRTALPMLCAATAQQTSGALKDLFIILEKELENQISPDAESCMHAALSRCRGLPQSVVQCLQELGKTLGIFDFEGQLKGLEATQQACKRNLQLIRENKENRLRSYQTLGLCAGAAIVILFI